MGSFALASPSGGKWPKADRGGSVFPSEYRCFAQKERQKDPFGLSASVLGVSSIKPFLLCRERLRHAALSPLEIHKVFPAGAALPDTILPRKKWKRLMEEAPEPERFPVLYRLPLWCASSLACTFRSPVLIRSFCLRVFAFPFGSARRGLSRVIHPGHIRLFRPFLYRRHKKLPGKPAAFCVLSVAPPLFAVKCFFTAENNLRRRRKALPPLQGEVAEPPAAKPEGSASPARGGG